MTHTAAHRRGRRTRRNSMSPRTGSGKNCKPSWHTTESKLASLSANAWRSITTGRNEAFDSRERAACSIANEMSAPITPPERSTAIAAASPDPAATSRTRSPPATSAAANTAGTKRRDQRPIYCSYAEVSTARPGAAWSPEPKFTLINVHGSQGRSLQRLPRRPLRRVPRRALPPGAGRARRRVLHARRVKLHISASVPYRSTCRQRDSGHRNRGCRESRGARRGGGQDFRTAR